MKIGWIGLGKLGLPCAVAMATKYEVVGYDINPLNMSKDPKPYQECGMSKDEKFNDYLAKSSITFGPLEEIAKCDVIFVAVQTPHHKDYEGITPLPNTRTDFKYKYLKQAVTDLKPHIHKDTAIVIVSTVLPGTLDREIKPLLTSQMKLLYNPYFIAMGTTMWDFFNPDLILIGKDKNCDEAEKLSQIYMSLIPGCNIREMSITSAELTKVSYNTFISLKIVFANLLGEICSRVNANVDDVTNALKSASKRITGGMYMSAGMGDAGGCHPRDNIAMSWLAQRENLSYDLFEAVMVAREQQAVKLAEDLMLFCDADNLPIYILGYAYKPNINLTVGSHALLVADILERNGYDVNLCDRFVNGTELTEPAVILIGIDHDYIKDYKFQKGSVVLDPFRIIKDQEDIHVIRIGDGDRR